jgi:hypothetical protein
MDFLKIRENLNKLKKAGNDLMSYLQEPIQVEHSRNVLLENTSESVIYKLKELKYEELSRQEFSKIVLLLRYLDQYDLDEYRTFFQETYSVKELGETPTKPEDVTKESITAYNEELKTWNKKIDNIKEWNRHYKFLVDSLNDVITIELYGDTTLDVSYLSSVYFKFYETNINDIEVFIQEIRTSPSEAVQNIKRVKIDDISASVPNEISSAHEVLFYFQNDEDSDLFRKNEDVVYGVYEKFIIRNDTMKKVGGEWGLDSERKNNFQSTSPFANPSTIPTSKVKTDTSISTMDIFEDTYTVDISECVYSEKVYDDGNMVFVIQPKEFFEEFETILYNPKLTITGITDEKSWDKKDDGSFHCRNGYSDALEYLEENSAGFSDKLDDIVRQVEESVIETMTEDEIYDKYVDGTANFKPYDLEFGFETEDSDMLYVNIYPKGIPTFDQHLTLSRDVFGEFSLEQDMEAIFAIYLNDSIDALEVNKTDIETAYAFLIGIGMRPCTEDLLEETLDEI